MENQLNWRLAGRQQAQEALAEKQKNLERLEAKHQQAAARLKEMEQIISDQIAAHLVGSASNKRLAKRYSKAASQMTGRIVEVRIRKPSTKESVGTFSRSQDRGHIQLDPELCAQSIVSTFLHETAHAMLHFDSTKPSKAHLFAPRTKNYVITNPARHDRHEDEANELRDKMVALLEFDVDPMQPNYEHRALDWLIKHS